MSQQLQDNEIQKEQEQEEQDPREVIQQKYGEFLPEGVDPGQVYKQWVRSIFGDNDPDYSLMYFILSQAKAAGIDPRVPRQIYAVPFGQDKQYSIVIGVEGLVTIAENTGTYGGTTLPEYEWDEQGNPVSCSIGVHKIVQGVPSTSFQIVFMDEYSTGKNLWKTKPKTMLKKVALVHALRATFSACAGMYVEEEIQKQDSSEVDASPDVKEQIQNAETTQEIQRILSDLNIEDKRRVTDMARSRMAELQQPKQDETSEQQTKDNNGGNNEDRAQGPPNRLEEDRNGGAE